MQEAHGWRKCNGAEGARLLLIYATGDVSAETGSAGASRPLAGDRPGQPGPRVRAVPAQRGLSGGRRTRPPARRPGDGPRREIAGRPRPDPVARTRARQAADLAEPLR